MLDKLSERIKNMNQLSLNILLCGIPAACAIGGVGIAAQHFIGGMPTYMHSIAQLPISMGQTAMAVFTEVIAGALLIDYYVKRYYKENE